MKYSSPETKSLQVNPQSVICASGGAPGRMKLPSVTKTSGAWI